MRVAIFHNTNSRTDTAPQPGETLQFVGFLEVTRAVTAGQAVVRAFSVGSDVGATKAAKRYRSWHVRPPSAGDMIVVETVYDGNSGPSPEGYAIEGIAYSCEPTGFSLVDPTQFTLTGAAVVDLRVDQAYELYDDVQTTVRWAVLPTPPEDQDSQKYLDWAHDNIIDPYTGVGHTDGDAWYDVEITASSDPKLVGRKFDWGY